MAKIEQTERELAFEVGNAILQKLIQKIANPPDSSAWKIDGLIDWYGRRDATWRPKIIAPLHDHRRTIERIPWTRFAKAHFDPQHQRIEAQKRIFKHLKQFSQIQARTSSWRASNKDCKESVEQLFKLNVDGSFAETGVDGVEDLSCALARDSKIITMDVSTNANKNEQVDEIKVDGEDVVLLDRHAFDGLYDIGGESDEAKQMKEAKEMAETTRLEQEKNFEGQMYPWRRSFRQSWRPPKHDHPKDYPNRPFARAVKMGFPTRLKTALFTFMPDSGQEYKLLSIEEQQAWRLQMPAEQFILECQLLERMMRKINYLNNPRYSREPKYFQALEIYQQKDPIRPIPYWIEPPAKGMPEYFHLNPPQVVFDGFEPKKTYVAHLHVMNKSPWSQRLRFIKPLGDEFFISSKEDPFQGKILISGMFCQFDVTYKPKTTIESQDKIEIQSEMDTCFVTLKSINPLPMVIFPPTIDLGYCLTNHSVSGSYTYTCSKAEAHFAMLGFCDDIEWHFMQTEWNQDDHWKGLQERYIQKNYVLFAPFLAYPREVKVKKNETQEIIILFRPSKVGKFSAILKIETSNGRHWEINVKGIGVDLQVLCNKIDGRRWRFGEYEAGIPFGDCTIGATIKHFVSIKNNCEVPVRFYWRVSNAANIASLGIVLDEKEMDSDTKKVCAEFQREFIINPTFGIVQALAEINIDVNFTPTNFKVYQQIARLYIDTRANHPLASNNWKNFRNQLFLLENEIQSDRSVRGQPYRFIDEEYAIHKIDNLGQIIKILEFPVNGRGIPIDVLCLPSLLNIGGGLTIETVRNYNVVIQNNSASPIQFLWEQPKIPFKFGIYENAVYFQPWSGEIQGNANQAIIAIVKAKKVGLFDKTYECNIKNSKMNSNEGKVSINFQVIGHIRGPVVAITPGAIDYGLIQVDSLYERDLVLTNKSGCRATFKLYTISDPEQEAILRPRDEPISLSSYGDALQLFKKGVPLLRSYRQLKEKKYRHVDSSELLPLIKVCRRVWYPSGVPYPEDAWQQKLAFYPSLGILEKNQSCVVRVVLKGTKCGYMRLAIICDVAELAGQTSMIVARAEIDAPRACLLPPMMDLGIQYLYCEVERVITLKNLRALPACFNWWSHDGIGDHKFVKIDWSQATGKIPPCEEINLTFKFNPQRLGPFECILVCEVWKQQFPLGLLIKAYIVDIQVSFHIFRPKVEDGHQLSGQGVQFERIKKIQEERKYGRRSTSGGRRYETATLDDPIVPCLDFGRRNVVGRVHTFKLLIHNHSPIQANVQVKVINHISEPETSLVRDELWMLSALTGHLSTLTPNRRDPIQSAMINKTRDFPLLSRHDDNHFRFFSSAGKSMLWRRVEGAMHQAMIKEGRSIGFLIYPHSIGILQPWSEWSCEVVCFSTLPGFYKDIIVVKIGRLSPFYFPVEIELIGNPLISRINNLEPCGLQDNKDTPELLLTWNAMPAGNPIIRRTFWVYNSSPFNMVIEWKLMMEVEEKEEKIRKGDQSKNTQAKSNKNDKGKLNENANEEQELKEGVIQQIIKEEEIINEEEGGEEGEVIEENANSIREPKLPNLCRTIFNVEENRENSLHCMLIPERNNEEWCVQVCIQEHIGIEYQGLIHITFQDFLEPWHSIPIKLDSNSKKDIQQESIGNLNVIDNPNAIANSSAINFDVATKQGLIKFNKQEFILKQNLVKHSHRKDTFKDIEDSIDESYKEEHLVDIVDPIHESFEGIKPLKGDEFVDIMDSINEANQEDEPIDILKLEEEIPLFETNFVEETPPFRIVPQKQVILGQKSSQFSITFQSLEATNFKAIFVGRTRIHNGQFQRKLAIPKFEFDSVLDKIDKQYIYRKPSTKHVCEHVVSYFNTRTSKFQSLLVHKTSLGDHVHLEQVNQKKTSKKGGAWADLGKKKSRVYRLEHDSDISDDENSITEEGNFPISILDIPDDLITDAFVPNQEIDLIQPLRVTVIARLFIPRLHCNVDEVLRFLLFGSLSSEIRFDIKTLFLTNLYLDHILFSIRVPPPFYIFNTRHGIIDPIIDGSAIKKLSILKNIQQEAEGNSYGLPPNWSLQLNLRFRPFIDEKDWYPKDELIVRDLVITFQDTHEQIVTLYGNVHFPEVTLQTEILSFGIVNCPNCVLCQDFSISNTSIVPLEWRIVTEESHEDMIECAKLDGFINWGHLKDLNKRWPTIWKATPEFGQLPGREGCMDEMYRQIVTITFSPYEPITYKETIWIEVLRGRGCRLVLEGQGSEIASGVGFSDSDAPIALLPERKPSKHKSQAK